MSLSSVLRKKEKGFTLIEVLVATFVFVIVMSSVSQIFVSAFSAYRREKIIQNNLENAQFAMNTMAKELRGSSITSSSTASNVKFYNYGEKTCYSYSITGGELRTIKSSSADFITCQNAVLVPTIVVVKDITAGNFTIIQSSSSIPKTVGKVTLSLQVGSVGKNPVNIQTTVSLRDYEVSGL